jgi:hypothetical protein
MVRPPRTLALFTLRIFRNDVNYVHRTRGATKSDIVESTKNCVHVQRGHKTPADAGFECQFGEEQEDEDRGRPDCTIPRHGGSTSAGLCLRATRGVLSVLRVICDAILLRSRCDHRAVVGLRDGYANHS